MHGIVWDEMKIARVIPLLKAIPSSTVIFFDGVYVFLALSKRHLTQGGFWRSYSLVLRVSFFCCFAKMEILAEFFELFLVITDWILT